MSEENLGLAHVIQHLDATPMLYSKLEVSKEIIKVREQSKTLIESVYKLYMNSDIANDDEGKLAKAIQTVEVNNLRNLLLQVTYSEHIVNTMMLQLEQLQQLDSDFLQNLIAAQNNVINVTLTVSNYVRNLPIYFKQLQIEISSPTNILAEIGGNGPISDMNLIENEDDFIKIPQRGMRELLKKVEEFEKMSKEEQDEMLSTENFNTNDDE